MIWLKNDPLVEMKTAPGNNGLRAEGTFALMSYPLFVKFSFARAHGMWTYEPRQGRKAATAVCSVSAVVTLALSIYDL